jgi:hypothetical protein
MRDNTSATRVDLGGNHAPRANHDSYAFIVFASAKGDRCPADAAHSRFS